MIRFRCTCGHPFETADDMAGGLVQCPDCGKLNDIPTLSDLAALAEDGTYKIDRVAGADDEAEVSRLAELQRAFARRRVDEYGAEIDLRPTMDDIERAGAEAVPLELKDEVRPGAPKYDPVTGELIRPMDIRTPTAADSAVPAIPVAQRTLKYASADADVITNGFQIFPRMFTLPNLVVIGFVFFTHLLIQVMVYVTVFILIFMGAPLLLVIGLLVAHYANTIDETGPEARDELPRPLRNVSWHDDMWGPFFNVTLAFGCAYGVGLLCLLPDMPTEVKVTLFAILSLLGTLAFPAILLTTTTSGSVLNLRPDRVWGVIRACGAAYVFMLVGWLVSIGLYLGAIIGTLIWLDSTLGGSAPGGLGAVVFHWAVQYPLLLVAIYLMHAYAWYLGLQYRKHHVDFPWVLQRYAGRRGDGTPAGPAPRQGFAVVTKAQEQAAAAAARERQAKLAAKAAPRVQPKPVQALPQPPQEG